VDARNWVSDYVPVGDSELEIMAAKEAMNGVNNNSAPADGGTTLHL
jgi:hypothetical protein